MDYQYWPDGQTALKEISWLDTRTSDATTNAHPYSETYSWDGLALLARGEETFTIQPHISGVVPLVASGKEGQAVVISDFLGTTLGIVKGEAFIPMPLTAFGEPITGDSSAPAQRKVEGFFTGKPYDSDLKAYTFLFRNYNPELARWTKPDPSGFPDGGNNMLYVLNSPLIYLDDTGLARLVNNSSYPIFAKDPKTNTIITIRPGQIVGTQGLDDGFDGIYNPLDDPNKPGSPATFKDTDKYEDVVRKFSDYANITITDAGFDSEGRPLIDFYHNNDWSIITDTYPLYRWHNSLWVQDTGWPHQPVE